MAGTGAGGGGGGPTGSTSCLRITTTPGPFFPCGRTYGIAYSPDGQLLATGTQARMPNVHLWRLSDGVHLRDLDGISGGTYAVAFSPDGKTLASSGQAAGSGVLTAPTADIVKLWDVATGSLLRTLPAVCGFYASSVVFSPDGTLIATSGTVGLVEIWRVADGARLTAIPYATTVHNVHFSPDGSKVIAAGVDRRATIWNVPSGVLALTLDGIADEMADAAFSPDGRLIATTGTNYTVKVWDAATGALRQTMTGHDAYVSHAVWIGSDRFVTNDWGGSIRSWVRDATGTFVASGRWSSGGQSLGIAVSPDRTRIAVGGADPATLTEGFVFLSP